MINSREMEIRGMKSGNDSWLPVRSVGLCFVERVDILHLFSLLWHHSLLTIIPVWQASCSERDAIKLCVYVCVRDPEGRVEGEWLLVGLGVGCRSVYTDVVWLQKLVVLLSQCHSAGIPSAQQNTSERHRTDMCSLCFTALLMRAKKSL